MLSVGIWGHPDPFSAATLDGIGLSLWQSIYENKKEIKSRIFSEQKTLYLYIHGLCFNENRTCYEKPVTFAGTISTLQLMITGRSDTAILSAFELNGTAQKFWLKITLWRSFWEREIWKLTKSSTFLAFIVYLVIHR